MNKKTVIILVVILLAFLLVTQLDSSITGEAKAGVKGAPTFQCNDHKDDDDDGYCDFLWNKAYCSDGSIPGDSDCISKDDNDEFGGCVPVCNSNAECGTNGYIGDTYCGTDGNVYRDYITYTCENAGKCSSNCNQQVSSLIWQTCESGVCTGGSCITSSVQLDPLCKPMKWNGASLSNSANLIFIPSNFNGDMELFRQKAEWVWSVFGNYIPFKDISALNAFYVPEERGSYCYFNCGGIQRLLCCDITLAKNISGLCTTGSRQTIVIHNDNTYGGAGYMTSDVATTSTHIEAPKVAVHEVGHTLFSLGDEYVGAGSWSSASNAPNCDYISCPKWDEMITQPWQVRCIGGACSSGTDYIGEYSTMSYLGYPFEEVNERVSCCAYYRETGSYPLYCNKFKTLAPDLDSFCGISLTTSIGATPNEDFVLKPLEYSFVKDANEEWILEGITAKYPGKYPISKTRGDMKGEIILNLVMENGNSQKFQFEDTVDVEYPGPEGTNKMEGYIKQPRKSLTIVIDEKKNGKVKSSEINGRPVKVRQH